MSLPFLHFSLAIEDPMRGYKEFMGFFRRIFARFFILFSHRGRSLGDKDSRGKVFLLTAGSSSVADPVCVDRVIF